MMGIDVTLANECKTAAVGQLTPDWRMHTNRKLQLGGAPHPPGGDCPGLNPPRHSTGEPVTGTTKNVHRSENKQRQRKLQEKQDLENYWKTHGGNASFLNIGHHLDSTAIRFALMGGRFIIHP